MQWEPRSQAGCTDRVTQGPLAQHEEIPSGREEMSPLPLTGPLPGSQPLQFCVLRAHSPHSSPGSAAQACLLVLQPGPSAPPWPGVWPWSRPPWAFGWDDCTWFPTSDPADHSEAITIVHQIELLFPLDTCKSETLTHKPRTQELGRARSRIPSAPPSSSPASLLYGPAGSCRVGTVPKMGTRKALSR